MEDEIKLVKEPINKLILTLAMPAVLGHVADIGYNLIDGIFVGQWVGPQGLAGIGLTFPLTLINMAISLMIGVGTSTAIGRYIGSKDYVSCNKVLSVGLVLTTIINLILSLIVMAVGDKVLTIMGADKLLVGYAMQYISVVAIGFVFMGIAMVLCDALRNEGIIKPSIIVMVIVLVGNIILDVLFMYVFKMGMYGAALATLISQILAAFYIITYYLTKKLNFKISFSQLDYKHAKEIFSVGSGVFLREIVEAVTLIVLNSIILSIGGSIYLASFGIIDKIIMLVYMPIGGFAEGLQPIISVNYGASQINRLKQTLKASLMYSMSYVVIASTLLVLFGFHIIKLFGGDEKLLSITTHGLNIMMLGTIFVPITIVSAMLFQGVGKVKESIVMNLSRQLIFLLPLLAVLPGCLGIEGVYYSYASAEILSAALAVILMVKYFKKAYPTNSAEIVSQ